MTLTRFSPRQLPDGVLFTDSIAGASAWRIDQRFLETPNGSRTFFTTPESYVPQKIWVFKDGTKTIQSLQIVLHPPNVVEFITAPLTGANLETTYIVSGSSDESFWIFDEPAIGVKDGVNQLFRTSIPYVAGKIFVYKNTVKLIRGASYNFIEIDPTTVQITPAPVSTDTIELSYFILV